MERHIRFLKTDHLTREQTGLALESLMSRRLDDTLDKNHKCRDGLTSLYQWKKYVIRNAQKTIRDLEGGYHPITDK